VRVDTRGWGEVTGKAGRMVNTVQKMHTHVCKCQYLLKLFQEWEEEEDKGEQ
jgi:hypothetical protein